MSHWLFKTAVASSLLYQNCELSRIRGSAEEIEKVLKDTVDEQTRLKFLKEKIYTIRKGLEIALERVQLNPHQGLYFALTVQRFVLGSGITTASFPEIDDKVYFDKTLELARNLETGSAALLGKDRTEAEVQRQGVVDFMMAQQCVTLLEECIVATQESEFVNEVIQEYQYESLENGVDHSPDIWQAGRLFGLGCLLPIVFVLLIGYVLSQLGFVNALDGMFWPLCGVVFGIFIAVAALEQNREAKRKAAQARHFEEFLCRTNRIARYQSVSQKRTGLATADIGKVAFQLRGQISKCRKELQVLGFDRYEGIAELRNRLVYMQNILARYSTVIPDLTI